MKLGHLSVAPISLRSGTFYRLAAITLYNTCHHFSHCVKHLRCILIISQVPYMHSLQMSALHSVSLHVCSRGELIFPRLLVWPEHLLLLTLWSHLHLPSKLL
jgi:hypothetical protein